MSTSTRSLALVRTPFALLCLYSVGCPWPYGDLWQANV